MGVLKLFGAHLLFGVFHEILFFTAQTPKNGKNGTIFNTLIYKHL